MKWVVFLLALAVSVTALPAGFDPRIPGWYGVSDKEVKICQSFAGRASPVQVVAGPKIDEGGTAQLLALPTETTSTIQGVRKKNNNAFFYEFEYFIEPVVPLTASFFLEEGENVTINSPVTFLFNRQISKAEYKKFNFTSPVFYHSIILAYQGVKVSVPFAVQ